METSELREVAFNVMSFIRAAACTMAKAEQGVRFDPVEYFDDRLAELMGDEEDEGEEGEDYVEPQDETSGINSVVGQFADMPSPEDDE